MSTGSTTPAAKPAEPAKKKGPLAGLIKGVENLLGGTVAGIDSVLVGGATAVGKLLSAPERALAEEAAIDIADGLKADDVASTTVATPAPVAPAAPAAS